MATTDRDRVSISKSALILSPCLYWAMPGVRWESDKFQDKTNRDKGTTFHKKVDTWIRKRQQA